MLATPSLQPVHQPSLAAVSASNGARPNDHVRPGLQTNAPQGARSVGQGRRHSDGRWVLHDWRGNTFRFVVCRNSIQSTMALQLRVSNHRWQPHVERADRKIDPRRAVAKAELDQGSVSRHDARPAGAPSPTRAIVAGVRLKWCGDELDPTVSLPTQDAEQVIWFVLSPVCSARGRLSRVTHPLPRGSAERARHARSSAKGPKPVCARLPQLWRVVHTSLPRRLPRPASLRGVSVPEVRFESLASVPCSSPRAAPVTSVGSRAHTPRDPGPNRSHPSE